MTERPPGVGRIFAIMAVVMIGTTLLTYSFGVRVLRLRALAVVHRSVIADTVRLLSALSDAESGQRGFIITGDKKYLEPYKNAQARLPAVLDDLKRARTITDSAATLKTIEELTQTKLNHLEQTIALRESTGFEPAAAVVRQGTGHETMERLREQIARLQEQQESAMRAETEAANRANRTRTLAFAIAGFVNLVFLLWAYRLIMDAISGWETAWVEAEKEGVEVRRQKDLLTMTLASIGDCVLVTDSVGRITFMNPVAERVTGWTFAEARLRPAAEVFKIANKSSRESIENPVEKVMKSGVIVGLPNHAVLIRKDGTELPIDDSVAPIREADRTMRGVVLVFRDRSGRDETEKKSHPLGQLASND